MRVWHLAMVAALPWAGCLGAAPGQPLKAQLELPVTAVRGLPVVLSGAKSQGAISEYRFDFGDGTPREITRSPETEHVYLTLGPSQACLVVVGSSGQRSGADCKTVRVLEAPPPDAGPAPDARPPDGPIDARPPDGPAPDAGPPPILGYAEMPVPGGCFDISQIGQLLTPPLGDDQGARILIPFWFPFWASRYAEVGISSNGYLQLAPPLSPLNASQNRAIPDPRTPNSLIAVLWDDLAPPLFAMAGSSQIYTYLRQGPAQNVLYIQWSNWSFYQVYNPPAVLTFQALLYDSGRIELYYCQLSDPLNPARASGSQATVGVEDAAGSAGTQHSYNMAGAVSTAQGIRFEPMR